MLLVESDPSSRFQLLPTGRVLRYVLQTFREEDRLGFHDPVPSLGNFFHL